MVSSQAAPRSWVGRSCGAMDRRDGVRRAAAGMSEYAFGSGLRNLYIAKDCVSFTDRR